MAEATSLTLLERVRVQSPDAWRAFVAIYSPLVYRWCRRMGVTSSDAADVSQEVFRSVAGYIAGFRRRETGDSFRGWLYTITHNKSRNHLEHRRRQPQAIGGSDAQLRLAGLPDEDDASGDPGMTADDRRLLVVQILEELRGEFGQPAMTAFWRMVVDGHSAADIAGDLQMSPKAVRQAKFRVLQRLRKELGDLE